MHSDNAAHRHTAMIAKDLILTKDPNRKSFVIMAPACPDRRLA
jgi:hypothetical protein